MTSVADRRRPPGVRSFAQSSEAAAVAGSRGFLSRWWVAIGLLTLFVSTDYKIRTRSAESSISGGADIYVLIEVAAYAIVFLYLVRTQQGPPRVRRIPAPLALYCAYIFLVAASLIYTPYPVFASVRVAEAIVLLTLTVAIVARASLADIHRFTHAYLVLITGSVLLGLAIRFPPLPNQTGRFTWLMVHPIISGLFLSVAVLLLTAYLVHRRGSHDGPQWRRSWYLAALVICVGGLLGTETRSAVSGTTVGVIVILWTAFPARQRLTAAVIGLPLAAAAALSLTSLVVAYLARGEDAAKLSTLNSRTDLWSLALPEVAARPLLGAGVSASRGIFLDKIGLGGGHNAVVNVAVDFGLVGLAVWSALLVVLMVTLIRLRGRNRRFDLDRNVLLAILVFLLVNSVFFEGIGALANVGGTWLAVVVAWTSLLIQRRWSESRTAATPSPVPARIKVSRKA